MRKNIVLCTVLFLFSGCALDQINQEYAACDDHTDWFAREECRDKVMTADPSVYNDSFAMELLAYKKLLREKVKNREMTEPEAGYAFQKKKTEINQRVAQIDMLNNMHQNIYAPQPVVNNYYKPASPTLLPIEVGKPLEIKTPQKMETTCYESFGQLKCDSQTR